MILKIRKNHLYSNTGWYVISKIADVSYDEKMDGLFTSEDLKKSWFTNQNWKVLEPEEVKIGHRYFPPSDKSGTWIRIMVKYVDGRDEEWVVQAETYLLNDDGKTIERLF